MTASFLPTILIVDDSQTMRAMIRRILNLLEAPIGPICEAADGAEGLAALRTVRTDLVLVDLNMPAMDGREMIARMRQDPALAAIPVVVISAQPDPEQIALLDQQGVIGFLAKPFTPESMRALIGPVLANAGHAAPVGPAGAFNLSLAEALAEALQTTAFITPQLIHPSALPIVPAPLRLVRINFKGKDTHGTLAIAASPELGDAIAANLDLADETGADDALMELANVTCGLLLRLRPGGAAGFHLSPPEISSPALADAQELFHHRDLVALDADGHLLAAHVATEANVYG